MAVIGAHLSKLDWVRNRKKIFICGFCVETKFKFVLCILGGGKYKNHPEKSR